MAWVRIDDGAWDHPKQLQAGPMAVALWLFGLLYSSRKLTDGFVPVAALATTGVPRVNQEAERLVLAGLWERVDGGFQVHDYHEYNPSREQVTTRRASAHKRLTDWRKRKGYAHGNGNETAFQPGFDARRNDCPVPVPDPGTEVHTQTDARASLDPTVAGMPRTAHAPGPGRRGRFAFEWRAGVPADLHAEFVRKLGGDEDVADLNLRAWYREVADLWPPDRPIGDDDFGFWRARFAEWQGTTRQRGRNLTAAPLPTYEGSDWAETCTHEPPCTNRQQHDRRIERDNARQEVRL